MKYKKTLLLIAIAMFAYCGTCIAQAQDINKKLNVSVTNNSEYKVKIVIHSMYHLDQPYRSTDILIEANQTIEVQLLDFFHPSASFETPEENLEFFGDSINLSIPRKVVTIDVLEDNTSISELKVVGKLTGDTYTMNIHSEIQQCE